MAGPTLAIREQCPLATPVNDGLMSAGDKNKLNGLTSATIAQTYDNGSSSANQTMNIAAAKGGGIILQAAAATVGSMLKAITSAAGLVFDVIDGAIPIVKAAGMFIQNDPGFGSPVMGSQTPNGYASYTSDGNGPIWGGTGMTAKQDAIPANSEVALTVNDVPEMSLKPDRVAVNNLAGSAGPTIAVVANVIAPTKLVCFCGDGLAKNVNPAFLESFIFGIIPTGAGFSWDTTGDFALAGVGVQGKINWFWFDQGTGKVYPSYVS